MGLEPLFRRIRGGEGLQRNYIFGPVDPVEPIFPLLPVDPILPVAPVLPVDPIFPVEPVAPFLSDLPVEPVAPVWATRARARDVTATATKYTRDFFINELPPLGFLLRDANHSISGNPNESSSFLRDPLTDVWDSGARKPVRRAVKAKIGGRGAQG